MVSGSVKAAFWAKFDLTVTFSKVLQIFLVFVYDFNNDAMQGMGHLKVKLASNINRRLILEQRPCFVEALNCLDVHQVNCFCELGARLVGAGAPALGSKRDVAVGPSAACPWLIQPPSDFITLCSRWKNGSVTTSTISLSVKNHTISLLKKMSPSENSIFLVLPGS